MFALCLLVTISLSGVLGKSDTVTAEAVKHAVASSFNGSVSLLDVKIQTDFDDNKQIFFDMLDEILNEKWSLRIQLDVNNKGNQSVGDHNLWFIDSYEAFRRLIPLIRAHGGDSRVYYLIVLRLSTYDKAIDIMHRLFSDIFVLMVADVNIIIEKIAGEVLFYTFFPYQKSACRSTVPVLVNRFNNETMTNRHIFPPKADNFHGCRMRVAARSSPSFLQIDRFKKRPVLTGFEAEILNELVVRINSEVQLVSKFCDSGTVYSNGTATGLFKMLEIGKADILIGAFIRDQYQDLKFTPSTTYFYTRLVIALRRPPYQVPKLSWLHMAFDKTTWVCSLMLMIVTAACITFATYNSRLARFFRLQPNRSRILHILAVAMGMSVKYLPTMNFLRLSFIIWSFGVLVLRAAYQGQLFDSYRRVIATKAPLTVKELLDENYKIYSYAPIVDRLTGVEGFHYEIMTQYSVLANVTEKNAMIGSEAHILPYFNWKDHTKLVTERLHAQEMCMYFQQHSIMTQKMNMIILRMDEAGILKHLRQQYKFLKTIKLEPQETYVPGPINLSRFKYILLSFSVLYMLACIAFVVELFWARF